MRLASFRRSWRGICFSLSILTAIFPREPGLAGFTEAKDDGLDEVMTAGKSCKATVKSSNTNKPTPNFLRARCPFCCPTNSVFLSTEGKEMYVLLLCTYMYAMLFVDIGVLPDGVYNRNTKIFFCCRSDRHASYPIVLPTRAPFYLLKFGRQCQTVCTWLY